MEALANDLYFIRITASRGGFTLASGSVVISAVGGIRGHDGDDGDKGAPGQKGEQGVGAKGDKGETGAHALPADYRFTASVYPTFVTNDLAGSEQDFAMVITLHDPTGIGTYAVSSPRMQGQNLVVHAGASLAFDSTQQTQTAVLRASQVIMDNLVQNRLDGQSIRFEATLTRGGTNYTVRTDARKMG